MQNQIKIYKKRLREMGFKRKTDRVFYYDNNGLFYVVSFKMQGKDIDQIGFEVSHKDMFEDGVPSQRCSPVGGWLGWCGMSTGIAGYVQDLPVTDAAAILERLTQAFFTYFKTASDWQAAMDYLQSFSYPRFTPDSIPAIHQDAGGLPVAWFSNDIANEMQNCQEFGEKIEQLFENYAKNAGFSAIDTLNNGFARQRGDIYECFHLYFDDLVTFFRVSAYVWSDACVGYGVSVFSNLNNDLFPHIEWLRVADVLRQPQMIETLFAELNAFWQQFNTPLDWLNYLTVEDGKHANYLCRRDLPDLKKALNNYQKEIDELSDDTSMPSLPENFQAADIEMLAIDAGEFVMGAAENDPYAIDWEYPQRTVKISRPFLLGKYPITQKEWQALMGNNPSSIKGANLPVDKISWHDAQEFIAKLNKQAGHKRYRLPTEAEWEYACRAGSNSLFCFGDDISKLGDYAWFNENSGGKLQSVGKKKPNAWGLYDMHGNVEEWVQDKAGKYRMLSITDPKGSAKSDTHIFRGGSYECDFNFCRSSKRSSMRPEFALNGVGLRVAMDIG